MTRIVLLTEAIELLKAGACIRFVGWGNNEYIYYSNGKVWDETGSDSTIDLDWMINNYSNKDKFEVIDNKIGVRRCKIL